jgi:hypothetical protein
MTESYVDNKIRSIQEFHKLSTDSKNNYNSLHILDYIFKKFISNVQTIINISFFKYIKRQHLIKYENNYYRKVDGKDQIFRINYENKIYYDNILKSIINITVDNVNKLTYLKPAIGTIKKDTIIYHGIGYQRPVSTDHTPYNWYGNWYDFPYEYIDSYVVSIPNKPTTSLKYLYSTKEPRLYQYKISNNFNVLLFDENIDSNTYLLFSIMFLDIAILHEGIHIKTNMTKGNLILDEVPIRIDIGKYDYTIGKNILNPAGISPTGLYIKDDKNEDVQIKKEYYVLLKLPSEGDGDKPLASKICDLVNNQNIYSLDIKGWLIKDVRHLMFCGQLGYIENIGATGKNKEKELYSDSFNFTPKTELDYNIYYKKYLKYKNKYKVLKKN